MKFLDKIEGNKILDSVDAVLFDIDGVLLNNNQILPGAEDYVKQVRKLGKKVIFVTNQELNSDQEKLNRFEASEKEIFTPNISFIAYLKSINFTKDLYVIGFPETRRALREAGFKVIEYKDIHDKPIKDDFNDMVQMSYKAVEICKNVGAVIMDVDFTVTLPALQVAYLILTHIDGVQLLCGDGDDKKPLEDGLCIIAGKYYLDMIERICNRKGIQLAKPGIMLKDLIMQTINITDPRRILMIGDSIVSDIVFGVNGHFQTLLVLTGVTTKHDLEEWEFPEEYKPDYVVNGLDNLVN